ncbi:MAG: tyrosine-type recombinase/integrase [Woeseiaceae bacterium]
MRRLFDRMAIDLQLVGYSECTRRNYLMHAKRFARHYQRSPEQLDRNHIREFLFHLIENLNVSRGTVRQVRAALRFLYGVTLARPQEIDWLPPARHQKALPVVLSGTEVAALFAAVRHTMYRCILMVMYSGGLRITEAFPGRTRLRHACPQTVRKVFRLALTDAGIQKDVTPHVLRHCFATHLLELGYDVTLVQALLGHRNLRSTMCYAHVTASRVPRDASPLDRLGTTQAAVLG